MFYYKSPAPPEGMLPQLLAAERSRCRIVATWGRDKQLSKRTLSNILGNIAQTLSLAALHTGDSGFPFLHADVSSTHECMLVDRRRLRPYMVVDSKGYLSVALAKRSSSSWVRERAHRIVLYSYVGPPPPGLIQPVVMHACNNTSCLAASHLVWGEQSENSSCRSDYYARQRFLQQGRAWPFPE